MSGVILHMEKGGGLRELIFGRGVTGGLLGITKAGIMDLGILVGQSVLAQVAQFGQNRREFWGKNEGETALAGAPGVV